MILNNNNSIPILQFQKLSAFSEITHFISTRKGGVSQAHLESLNLGSKVGDDPANVAENKSRLADVLGIKTEQFIFPVQTHENQVKTIKIDMVDELSKPGSRFLDNTDALITNVSGLCLSVLVADCVPILFYDPVRKVIAATHAGWRGTVKNIAGNTLSLMVKEFNCQPSDIIACIGPSIGPEVYVVGHEVADEFTKVFKSTEEVLFKLNKNDKSLLNLWNANKIQLMDGGIPEENIEFAYICTLKHSDTFFSSRKNNGKTGRFGAGIMLK